MKKLINTNKKALHYIILYLCLITLVKYSKSTFVNLNDYIEIFSEEFNSIDNFELNWEYEIGNKINGWGNAEKQYYRSSSDNIYLTDNELHIRAQNNNFQNFEYTSARITTENTFHFTYGYVITKMKAPKVKGAWPSFWMLGTNSSEWPKCGEIDFIEGRDDDDLIGSFFHWFDDSNQNKGYNGKYKEVPNRDEYHIYELVWDTDFIRTFVDGEEIIKVDFDNIKTDTFRKPFYFIINLAIGGNYPQKAIEESKFPFEMVFDYIKVYQKIGKENYEHTPKKLIKEIKKETFNPNIEYLYFPCFKYGELRLNLKFPSVEGITFKVYLFSQEGSFIIKGITYRDSKSSPGEIAVLTTEGNSNILISGAKWKENGEEKEDYLVNKYSKDEIDLSDFNEYIMKWDDDYFFIYSKDILIYSFDISKFPSFHKYYYLSIHCYNPKNLKINTFEIKDSYIYQYKIDTIELESYYNHGKNEKIALWVVILLILFL